MRYVTQRHEEVLNDFVLEACLPYTSPMRTTLPVICQPRIMSIGPRRCRAEVGDNSSGLNNADIASPEGVVVECGLDCSEICDEQQPSSTNERP